MTDMTDITTTDYIMVPMQVPCNTLHVSDGYHTFEELYQHCDALFYRLCTENVHSYKVMGYGPEGSVIYKVATYIPGRSNTNSHLAPLGRCADLQGNRSKGWVHRELPRNLWHDLRVPEAHQFLKSDSDMSERQQLIEYLIGQPMPPLDVRHTSEGIDVIALPGSRSHAALPMLETLEVPCNVGMVSDGTNTFNDLYTLRYALFIALCHQLADDGAWKALLHDDGTMFDDYFIAGILLPQGRSHSIKEGMITYHLPIELWGVVNVTTLDKAAPWDGHTPSDVVSRLLGTPT